MSDMTIKTGPNVHLTNNNTVTGGNGSDPVVGSGALGGSGAVPGADGHTGPNSIMTFQAILNSIAEFMPEGTNGENDEVKLLEITTKLRELEDLVNKKKIELDTAKKREALGEKQARLDEAQKKIDEAEEAQKHMSIWDKIKLAFQWIGAIISIIVGAVMIATGAGAVAGGLLIAAGVAGIVMAIDSTMKEASPDHLGIAGQAARASGKSLEDAQKADMIFGYVMVAISAALAIASLGAAFGPAIYNAVAGGASAATEAAATITEGAVTASEIASTGVNITAKMVQQAMTIVSDLLSLGTAVGDVVVGVETYNATNDSADAKKLQAEAKEIEALMQVIDDMIDQAIARLKASSERFDAIVDDLMSAVQDRGQSLAQARFKG